MKKNIKSKCNCCDAFTSTKTPKSNVRVIDSNDVDDLVQFEIKKHLNDKYKEFIEISESSIREKLVKPYLFELDNKKYWIVYDENKNELASDKYQIVYSEYDRCFGILVSGKIISINGDFIKTLKDL